LAPLRDADEAADSDQRLVAAVRRGDDRAFEVLYHRYQRRIHVYVLGMVKDHGRAEDVTQEVFVSALRRMRETEQPLAFKPWLYQIAKNGCIDAFRRSKRAEEVSYDAEDALAPADHSKLVGSGPSPDAAVAVKQDLDNLCGAFGGLSETHHEILVLRELEGLSYQEIGQRMGMSRPAVESTLFRARRRLTEEYDDIVSGARCLRITEIIGTAVESQLGTRDARRLARHLAHCQSCRREALAAGLDRGLFTRPSVRERVASRVAAFLPFPVLGNRFRRGGGTDAAAASAPQPGRWSAHLPMLSDHLSSGWGKAAAGAAVLAAGVGGAAGVHQVTTTTAAPPKDRPALVQPARTSAATTPTTTNAPKQPVLTREAGRSAGASKPSTTKRDRTERAPRLKSQPTRGSDSPTAAGRATSPGGGPVQTGSGSSPTPTAAEESSNSGGGGSGRGGSGGGGGGGSEQAKTPASPAGGAGVTPPPADVKPVTDTVNNTVDQTTDAVGGVTEQTTEAVDNTVQTVTGGGPVAEAVDNVTDTVDDVVDGVGTVVDDTVSGLTNGLGGGRGR
jgi:RNA polymerase sigma factor (sigma-70 family)